LQILFEKGALEAKDTFQWVDTNLFATPQQMIRLRVGDALKFTARNEQADGVAFTEGSITVDAKEVTGDPAKEPVVVRFTEPGVHRIEGLVQSASGPIQAFVEVEVLKADFGKVLELVNATPRDWSLPGVPAELELEADRGLSLVDLDTAQKPSKKVQVSYQGYLEHPVVLARLSPGGPVVAATCFNAVNFSSSTETNDARIVEVLPDGTRVVDVGYAIRGGVPADLSMWIDMFVPDAVFEDGSTRYHLTAADFDENGIARIRIYAIAASDEDVKVCHWIKPDYEEGETSP